MQQAAERVLAPASWAQNPLICQAVSRFLGCGGTGIILLASTPSRWKASACSRFGWAMIAKVWSGRPGRVASSQDRLPSSWRMVRRLRAGRPVPVVLVAAFRFARPDTSAFCTGVFRRGGYAPRSQSPRTALASGACAGAIRDPGQACSGRHERGQGRRCRRRSAGPGAGFAPWIGKPAPPARARGRGKALPRPACIAAADFTLPGGWRDEVRADLAAQLEAGGTLYGCHDDGTLFARTKAGDQVISRSVDRDS